MANLKIQGRLSNWEVLSTNLKNHRDALPALQPGQVSLEQLVAEGQALNALQSQLTAAVRDVTPRFEELLRRGSQLREFLAAALRNELGPESPQLIEFGVKPRRRRRRPATPTTPPAPPEPPRDELQPAGELG